MFCSAWRNDAVASANERSRSALVPCLCLLSFSSREGVSEASSGLGRGVLQLRPARQAVDLDDAGIAGDGLRAERLAHGTGDDLQLLLILGRERDQHDEEADQEAHQVGKGDEPAVTAAVSPVLASRHGVLSVSASGPGLCRDHFDGVVAMLFRQVGQQHLAHQRRALGVADHQHAVDDRACG